MDAVENLFAPTNFGTREPQLQSRVPESAVYEGQGITCGWDLRKLGIRMVANSIATSRMDATEWNLDAPWRESDISEQTPSARIESGDSGNRLSAKI